MAASISLGVHTPVALPYLVAEGLLPLDPKPDQYQWDTYLLQDGGEEIGEEVLATKNTVVWSQGSFIRNVYRFHLEGESVVQAILTNFPVPHGLQATEKSPKKSKLHQGRVSHVPKRPVSHRLNDCHEKADLVSARALVVLLKSKAHVYFEKGTAYLVELPFDVERAFAAPRGLILQRKPTTLGPSVPSTPRLPAAPPNSLFASQSLLGPSRRRSVSPTLLTDFAKASFSQPRPVYPSPLSGNPKLDSLFQEIVASCATKEDEDVTNLYSLTNPLSDLGVVTYSLQRHKARSFGKLQSGMSVEFEGLDPSERLIYVSAKDELVWRRHGRKERSAPLILLVTFNSELSAVTLWHAWYLEEKTLQTLLKVQADHKEAKARRRSSFLSANLGTGAATPAIRRRDGTRESFAGSSQPQGDMLPLPGTSTSRKPTQQEAEAALASQLDPDYMPVASQQSTRESRRISSMNNDVRTSQNAVNTSFGAANGRRATSFGGTHGRRSLTHRKSRGSTPSSIHGTSQGGEDGTMELDSTIDFENDGDVDEILRHIRATFDAFGADSALGSVDEGFNRELIVRKIHSFSVTLSKLPQRPQSNVSDAFKVATLSEPYAFHGTDDARLKIFVFHQKSGENRHITLMVKQRTLWPAITKSPTVAIPFLVDDSESYHSDDILTLRHNHVHGVIFGKQQIQFSLDERTACPLPAQAAYRIFSALDTVPNHSQVDKDVGSNRTLPQPQETTSLKFAGEQASYDEVTPDLVHHRRGMQICAEDSRVDLLLSICEAVLPTQCARAVRSAWCIALAWLREHPENLASTACDAEFVAVVATVFMFALPILDPKARAVLNVSKVAAGKNTGLTSSAVNLQKQKHEAALSSTTPWSWMPMPRRRSSSMYRSTRAAEKSQNLLLVVAAVVADEISSVLQAISDSLSTTVATVSAARLMLALHIMREEQKLFALSVRESPSDDLAPVITQLGLWLGLEAWGFGNSTYYAAEGVTEAKWAFLHPKTSSRAQLADLEHPIGVFEWFERCLKQSSPERFPSLLVAAQIGTESSFSESYRQSVLEFTPRIVALSNVLANTRILSEVPAGIVESLVDQGVTVQLLESFPESTLR